MVLEHFKIIHFIEMITAQEKDPFDPFIIGDVDKFTKFGIKDAPGFVEVPV